MIMLGVNWSKSVTLCPNLNILIVKTNDPPIDSRDPFGETPLILSVFTIFLETSKVPMFLQWKKSIGRGLSHILWKTCKWDPCEIWGQNSSD